MPNELPPKDLKTVWQSQHPEAIQMSIDEIRTKVRNFERKIRRRNLREYVAAAFIAAGFAFFAWHSPKWPIVRVGHLTVAAGGLYFAYQLHRRGSSRTQPKELGTMGCLDFYLGQLERERTLLDESWKWMIWLIPGFVILMAGAIANRLIGKALPFLVITCLWIGTWLWMMLVSRF
jgi:hypothetical protein